MVDTNRTFALLSAVRDRERSTEVYRRLALARYLEKQIAAAYAAGHLTGWVHSCEGHEALGAAIAYSLRDDDHLVPHYRSRPAQLGKGMTVREVLAEVVGTVLSGSGGRGGETHVVSAERRVYGMTGILGANLPIAVGVAYASKMTRRDEVTLCTFGDGTANRGTFHEALNLAAIWQLPVLFVCENNQFAEMSYSQPFVAGGSIAARAGSYGMVGERVDGGDTDTLIDVLREKVDAARRGEPSLVEVDMLRLRGHWEGDQQRYRTFETEPEREGRDPVGRYRALLLGEWGYGPHEVEQIEAEVRTEVDEALAWALAAPRPTAEDVLGGVYAEEQDDD